MNSFFPYLLKISGGIAMFVILYYFVLRNDGNLQLKRWYLLSALVFLS